MGEQSKTIERFYSWRKKTMRVLIDGRVLAHDHISGVQRHAQEISKALQKTNATVDIAIPKYKNRYYQQFWEHTFLPFYARKYDILYCPSNIAPFYLPKTTKLAITLHDLAFLDFPEHYSSLFQKYYTFLVPKNLKRAQHIFTISNFSKKRIIEEYPWTKEKITVIYHGVSAYFTPSEESKSNNVLYVGSMNTIKNFQALLEIFLLPEFKTVPLTMILPGTSTFTQNKTISMLLEKAENAGNINIIRKVNQHELKEHYQKAKLFVFPSFHESFGLPPLEAMACGTPVIVSHKTALPEVCGDAALYVNPDDLEEIANKIKTLLEDETLQHKLRSKGLEHVKQFQWTKSAEAYLKVFKGIIEK
jgi:glycosyltransferase involved in cell wall biosynthesis